MASPDSLAGGAESLEKTVCDSFSEDSIKALVESAKVFDQPVIALNVCVHVSE